MGLKIAILSNGLQSLQGLFGPTLDKTQSRKQGIAQNGADS